LGQSVHTVKNTTDVSAASKEDGLEVIANKVKYIVISCDQIAKTKSQYED